MSRNPSGECGKPFYFSPSPPFWKSPHPAELLGFCAVEMEKEPKRKRSEIRLGNKGKNRTIGFERI